LPGDLETPGLEDMLAEEPQPCEVLLAPHHGSRRSNSPALAAWCKPRWVVFSDDGRWNVSAINETYRTVGGRPLHTCDCGAICVQIDNDGVRVFPFVQQSRHSSEDARRKSPAAKKL
jgi:competence protein ComEC